MKKISISLFIMVTALFLTSCGGDQELNVNNNINAIVDGYVFDYETNLPIDGAKVTISDKSATTDANGYYKISGLATGDYCAKLEKEGYAAYLDCSGSIMTSGANYYGDAIQTSQMYKMYPADKTLELTFRYYDAANTEWLDVSSGLDVNVEYTNTNLLTVFETLTTDSRGSISIPAFAYSELNVIIDQKLGTDNYYLNTDISMSDMKEFDGSIRVQVAVSAAGAASEVDL